MKNRKNPRNKIYEIRTYRAVRWCFTRSPILRSYIFVYSNQHYIYDGEIERKFYVCTYMRKLSVGVIVLTIWFKRTIFFLYFHFIQDYLLKFLCFSFFVVMFWMHVIHPLRWVKFMAGVENGSDRCMNHEIQWSQPWRTPAMKPTHWTGQVTCIQIFTTKNEKISKCQEIVPNKVENREKKMLLLNQMVKTITPTDNFLM